MLLCTREYQSVLQSATPVLLCSATPVALMSWSGVSTPAFDCRGGGRPGAGAPAIDCRGGGPGNRSIAGGPGAPAIELLRGSTCQSRRITEHSKWTHWGSGWFFLADQGGNETALQHCDISPPLLPLILALPLLPPHLWAPARQAAHGSGREPSETPLIQGQSGRSQDSLTKAQPPTMLKSGAESLPGGAPPPPPPA